MVKVFRIPLMTVYSYAIHRSVFGLQIKPNLNEPTSNVLHMLLHTLHLHCEELLTDSLIKRRKPVEFGHINVEKMNAR